MHQSLTPPDLAYAGYGGAFEAKCRVSFDIMLIQCLVKLRPQH